MWLRRFGRYLCRHWSGKLGLARSFWVNGVAVHLFVLLGASALARYLNDARTSRILLVMLGGSVLVAAVQIWQAVGIWRAGAKGKAHPFAALLARGCVVAGVLASVVNLVNVGWNLPALLEGSFYVRLLGKHDEAELRGTLNDGAADALCALLEAHPQVRTLHVTSPGGLANEGRGLAKVVRRHRLRVVVDSWCESACVLVLLAGEQRLVRPEAKVGFHRARGVGGTDRLSPNDAIYEALTVAGTSLSFRGRVLETPSHEMWYPSQKRLLAEKVITGVAGPGEFVYCPPYETVDEARRAFEQHTALGAMAEIDSARFQRLMVDYLSGPLRGATKTELTAPLLAEENALFEDAYCHPAVTVAQAQAKRIANITAKVAIRFPDRCAKLMSGDFDTTGLTDDELGDEYSSVMRAFIVESSRAPSPAPTPQELDEAVAALHRKLSRATLETINARKPGERRRTEELCSAAVEYHRAMVELEPALIARLLWHCPSAP